MTHGQSNEAHVSSADDDGVFTSAAKEPAKEAVTEPEPFSKRPSAISSGPFEISPASFASPPPSEKGPPSAVFENAMERGRAVLPLSTVVGIGFGVFVLLVGLTLLLFR